MSNKKYFAEYLTLNPSTGGIDITEELMFGDSVVSLEKATIIIEDGTLYITGDKVGYDYLSEYNYFEGGTVYKELADVDMEKYIVEDFQIEERYLTFKDRLFKRKTKVIKKNSIIEIKERTKYSYTLNPFKITGIHLAKLLYTV